MAVAALSFYIPKNTNHLDNSMHGSDRQIFSVSELNHDVRQLIERGFPLMWIQGEISNYTAASSGHWYFSLKDAKAQVQCAMFRNRNRMVQLTAENGLEVLVRARVTLYEPRGNYQLVIEHMEEAGVGALQRQFEALKLKLSHEGLFAAEHKHPLPALVKKLGVITSPTGAAVRDVLTVLQRRFPAMEIIIYPAQVQGEQAPDQLCRAIERANQRDEVDALLLTRGGGSLEDLWAFNDEILARTIFASRLPVVSAVGHEVDFTIADFVADVRAATPSAAAELLSPDQVALQRTISQLANRMAVVIKRQLAHDKQRFQGMAARLQHPARLLQQQAQRADELEMRLRRAATLYFVNRHRAMEQLQHRLQQHNPTAMLNSRYQNLSFLGQRLQQAIQHKLQLAHQGLAKNSHALQVLSPLATLSRGYAIVQTDDARQALVHDANAVKPGQKLKTRLGNGIIISEVKETRNE